jgi:hypothetical protein
MTAFLGDKLNEIVTSTINLVLQQAEYLSLTWNVLGWASRHISENHEENKIGYVPVGWDDELETICYEKEYIPGEVSAKYEYFRSEQLPLNSVYALVAVMEAVFSDITYWINYCNPDVTKKRGLFGFHTILDFSNLDDLKKYALEEFAKYESINTFKDSPAEYANRFKSLTGVPLPQLESFRFFVEMKASRDVYLHNNSMANEIYIKKAGDMAREKNIGVKLPISIRYYLKCFDKSLELLEHLSIDLNKKWPSKNFQHPKVRRPDPSVNSYVWKNKIIK